MAQQLNMSMNDLKQTLVRNKAVCLSCGRSATGFSIRWYTVATEDSGNHHVLLDNHLVPCWVYNECHGCGYQTALWKMVKGIDNKREERRLTA